MNPIAPRYFPLLFMVLVRLLFPRFVLADDTRDVRENRLAGHAVLKQFIAPHQNPSVVAGLQIELAVALLGVKQTKSSMKYLVDLSRFYIGEGPSESYDCYVVNKGIKILPFIKQADPKELANRCIKEVNDLSDHSNSPEIYHVCRSQEVIESDLRRFIDAIKNGHKCPEGDF